MFRIDSDGNQDNLFTDGDPLTGAKATVVSAAWLNAIQEEAANVIEGAGITLDKADNTQLLAAILTMAGGGPMRISIPGEGLVAASLISVLAGVVGNVVAIGSKLKSGTSLDISMTRDGLALASFTMTPAFAEITGEDLTNIACTKGSVIDISTSNPVGTPIMPMLYVDIMRTA
ncbi:MAG: hypothetical protein KQI62_02270 [Deltaproteobacteria bacterium]|nr:hypothetical protein [Deltaproteobacteria bacterium]